MIIPIESGGEECFEAFDLIREFLIAIGKIHNPLFTILDTSVRIDFTIVRIIATLSESLEVPHIELTFDQFFPLAITPLLPDINSVDQLEVTELVKCLVNPVILEIEP